ncbi:MAG: NAD(P)/FAD-dependent oxidoreductase [Gemmatimonadota bacterium]
MPASGSEAPPGGAAAIPAAPDVIVIGGGTAGAAASRLLASWGHLVLMVEREVARAPLAESLPPSCIPLLETVGVRAAVDAAGFVRGGGNTVWWGGEPMRVEPFPGGRLGYQVLRERLEEVLGECARHAGVVRLRPATAVRVEREGDLQAVELSLPEGRHVVRAPWVLDCSGRSGVLARASRVASPDGVRTLALIGGWEREGGWPLPDETHTLVESADWGWGWSVPVSRERRFFTAMVDPGATPVAGEGGMPARYEQLLRSLPALGALVRDARSEGAPWAYEATPYHSTEVAVPGALLVGDAASMIDPLSSFGVKKALASAWLAAVVVHTALVAPRNLDAALGLYREREADYVRSAARALRCLSRDAQGELAAPFWSARAEDEGGTPEGDLVDRLRGDPEVLAAFERLRNSPTVRFVPDARSGRVSLPVVRGNVVVPEEHLVLRGVAGGVRYLRSVDLLALADVAPRHDDVGEIYAQYVRTLGPIPLPDLLGALSVLLGKGALTLA